MASGLRKLIKNLTPHGLIEARKAREHFQAAGRSLTFLDLWRSDWLFHHLEQTGLALLPPRHLKELRCVVDVGANVGQWSSMLLDCVTPQRLIIVEPLPQAFAELEKKFGGHSTIELRNTAVGDSEGRLTFSVTRDTTGASALPPRTEMRELVGGNWSVASTIEVPVTTLDRLLADMTEISLLKIDVQGFELSVFAGAKNTLAKTKFVLVELNFIRQYEGGSWLGDIHEFLTRSGDFYLANTTKPLVLNGRASMCDGLYVNSRLVPDFAPRDFL